MRMLGLVGIGVMLLGMMSLSVQDHGLDAREPVQIITAQRPLPPMPCPPEPITVAHPGPAPELVPQVMRVKVTACSPHDSAADAAFYAKHGYEGSTYNVAAHNGQFPKGTLIHVPGYMEKSYPGKFWKVDSAGGPVIRRSAERGVRQIDVKFRTKWSADQWGVQWLNVSVITPEMQRRHDAEYARWYDSYTTWSQAQAAYSAAYDAYIEDLRVVAEEMRRRRGGYSDVPVVR